MRRVHPASSAASYSCYQAATLTLTLTLSLILTLSPTLTLNLTLTLTLTSTPTLTLTLLVLPGGAPHAVQWLRALCGAAPSPSSPCVLLRAKEYSKVLL